MTPASRAPERIKRLKVLVYICDCGETKASPDHGFIDVYHAFEHRPRDCQYAVVELTDGTIGIVDFYEVRQQQSRQYEGAVFGDSQAWFFEEYHAFPDVDTAVAAAAMLYGEL